MSPVSGLTGRIAFQPIANSDDKRISQDQSLLAQFPKDLKLIILKYLDLRSLARISVTGVFWNNLAADDRIWAPIAFRIDCFIKSGVPIYRQVIPFMTDLLTRGGRIIKVIRGPTIEQFNNLQVWLKARDTIIAWRTLAKLTTYQFFIPLEYPKKPFEYQANQAIEEAKKFRV